MHSHLFSLRLSISFLGFSPGVITASSRFKKYKLVLSIDNFLNTIFSSLFVKTLFSYLYQYICFSFFFVLYQTYLCNASILETNSKYGLYTRSINNDEHLDVAVIFGLKIDNFVFNMFSRTQKLKLSA